MDTVAKTGEIVQPNNVVTMQRSWIDALSDEENTLTKRAEDSFVEALQKLDNGVALFERRAEVMTKCYQAALKRTRPEDWVLFKDRQGNERAMLTGSGADAVSELYGIVVLNIRPLNERGEFAPQKILRDGDPTIYGYRAWCDAFSRFNGRAIQAVECTRWSDEDFTGRSVDSAGKLTKDPKEKAAALDSDLRVAVQKLLYTKPARILANMTRVPVSELRSAGLAVERCTQGGGYGKSDERAASALTTEEVAAERTKLGDEILRRVGGDKAAAAKLLVECTSSDKFKGFDSIARMTQEFQVKNAWKKLREHKMFGDAMQSDTNGGAA